MVGLNQTPLFLLVENDFYSTFLISMWLNRLRDSITPDSVLVRDDLTSDLGESRESFHRTHRGKRKLSAETVRELSGLYPELNEVSLSLIELLGVPEHSVGGLPKTSFLGENLDSDYTKACFLERIVPLDSRPFLFIFVDQLLSGWWMDEMSGRILNGHPAILPYARGFRAIEGVARLRNEALFRLACGASIHYVDERIDAGDLVRVERVNNPFQARSLSDLRAQLFALVFRLLTETAEGLVNFPNVVPAGVAIQNLHEGHLFLRRDSTLDSRREASEAFLELKSSVIGG